MALQDGRTLHVRVAGTMQDVNGNRFAWTKEADAYTNAGTLAWLGGPTQYTELLPRVREGAADEAHVRAVAGAAAGVITARGGQVYITTVPPPGEQPGEQTGPAGDVDSGPWRRPPDGPGRAGL